MLVHDVHVPKKTKLLKTIIIKLFIENTQGIDVMIVGK